MQKYLKYLQDIYGKSVVNGLLEIKGNFIKFKNKKEINHFFKNYDRKKNVGCWKCIDPKNDAEYEMHQDFPGWLGNLKFEEGKIINKNMILIGLEIASRKTISKTYKDLYNLKNEIIPWINIWYQLGYFSENEILQKISSNELKYWKNLKELFPDKYFKLFLERAYGFDLAKCYTYKEDKENARKKCTSLYLKTQMDFFDENEELNLIFVGGNRAQEIFNKFYQEIDKNSEKLNPEIDKNFEKLIVSIKKNHSKIIKRFNFRLGHFKNRQNWRFLTMPHISPGYTTPIWKNFRNELESKEKNELIDAIIKKLF